MAASRTTNPPQTATTSTAPAEHVHNPELDTVPRIKPQELRDRIARGEVTVIDVRDAQSYLAGHIPGALHIPMTRLDGEVPYLPKDKPIVTYCT
ncbi:MAG: rhodanese-like domain-containing protein [Thermoanaerobaculia bacterium]